MDVHVLWVKLVVTAGILFVAVVKLGSKDHGERALGTSNQTRPFMWGSYYISNGQHKYNRPGVAQSARAGLLGSSGRRLKSGHPDQ